MNRSKSNADYRLGLLVSPTLGPVLPVLFKPYPGFPGCWEMQNIGLYDKEYKLNNDLRMHLAGTTFQTQDALADAAKILVINQNGHQVQLKGEAFSIKPFAPFELPVHVTHKGNKETEKLRVSDADKIILLDADQPYLRGKANVEVCLSLPHGFTNYNGKGLDSINKILSKFSNDAASAQKTFEEQVSACNFIDPDQIETSIRIEGQSIFFRAKGVTVSAEATEVRRLIFSAVQQNLEKDARKQNLEDQLLKLDKQRQQLLQELNG